jgi:hypothetical protein
VRNSFPNPPSRPLWSGCLDGFLTCRIQPIWWDSLDTFRND